MKTTAAKARISYKLVATALLAKDPDDIVTR